MRWLTIWATAVVACFGLVCAAALYDTRQDAKKAAREATVNIGRVVADGIRRDIELVDLALQSILNGLRVAEAEGLDPYRRHRLLFDNLPQVRGVGNLVVLDREGNMVTDTNSVMPRGMAFDDRDYFQVHKGSSNSGLYVSQPFYSRLTNLWSIAVSRRVTREDGSFGGVVAGTLRVAYLESLFQRLDLRQHGVIMLLRANGAVMARYPAEYAQLGQGLSGIELFRHYPASDSGYYETKASPIGLARLYSYAAVPSVPLVVLVGMADTDIYSAWRSKAWIISSLTLLLCVGTLVLVWMLRREFTLRLAAERSALRSETRYRVLAENSADIIAMSRADGTVTYISPAIKDVLGWAPNEIEGRSVNDFVQDDYAPLFSGGEQSWPRMLTFPARHRDGAWVWLEASVRRLPPETGDDRYVLTIRDVSRRKKIEDALAAENAQLQAMAVTDSLTSLANRRRFDEVLEREWRRARRDQSPLALLLIDADHFKALNDHYGHQHGDRYLRTLAQLIQGSLRRPADMAARYGGEEFAVLLPDTDLEGAYRIAEAIRQGAQDARLPHEKSDLGVMTVSIGVDAMVPEDGESPEALVRRADAALYAAKRQGRNRTCVDEPHGA